MLPAPDFLKTKPSQAISILSSRLSRGEFPWPRNDLPKGSIRLRDEESAHRSVGNLSPKALTVLEVP